MKTKNSFAISTAIAVLGVCALLTAQDPGSTGTSVVTWQNDNARTGQNLKEGTLVYNTLSKSNFGQLCSVQLDGQVYAQPLVITNSKINGTRYPYVAYVVTQNDTLYAIDGTPPTGTGNTCGPIASLPFLTTGATNGHSPADCSQIGGGGCGTIAPKVGILGTPVIAFANHTATMYLVTETQTYNSVTQKYTFYHYLHSVDLPTLTENASVQIYPPGQQGNASFFSQEHIQRPSLLYANSYVYVAFSMMDGAGAPYPNGAVFAYNPNTLAEAGYFQTSQGGVSGSDGGGIWQGGAGLAYGPDSATSGTNYVYFTTANGAFNASTNYGDSFVKLNATPDTNGNLIVADYFTPADQYFRSTATGSCSLGSSPGDYDFGSGGVMLIPPHELNTPYLGVTGDKEGGIWFINLANPGQHKTTCDNIYPCTVIDHGNIQSWPVSTSISYAGPVIHNNPVFWENSRYQLSVHRSAKVWHMAWQSSAIQALSDDRQPHRPHLRHKLPHAEGQKWSRSCLQVRGDAVNLAVLHRLD